MLSALGLAACEQKQDALSSAGGLSESRLPTGIRGDSPAPTSGRPTDAKLQDGWKKLAQPGEHAPTHGDTPSGVTVPFPHQLPDSIQ
ncbi:MAG: hypothetical protein U0165_06345 [Polyangiaceae bacterium]